MLNQLYEDYCVNRLPCGICRLMNAICPKMPIKTNITCTGKQPWEDAAIDIMSVTTTSTMEDIKC